MIGCRKKLSRVCVLVFGWVAFRFFRVFSRDPRAKKVVRTGLIMEALFV